jgi:hypothetical protein
MRKFTECKDLERSRFNVYQDRQKESLKDQKNLKLAQNTENAYNLLCKSKEEVQETEISLAEISG